MHEKERMAIVEGDKKNREAHKVIEDLKNKALKFEGKTNILDDEN